MRGVFATWLAVAGAVAGGTVAAPAQQLTFNVQMSPYGTIGTYKTAKEKNGDSTTIRTEAHIKVSLAGVVLHRLDMSRIERQIGGRIVHFSGTTTENGKSVAVEGKAVGDHFVITTPTGTVTAPGTIRTTDPWPVAAPGESMAFMPDTGMVTTLHTSNAEQSAITIGEHRIRASHYQIDASSAGERYEIWMDENQTPVLFTIVDRDGTVTFTSTR